ncbi:hypothetical protein BC829DRAFT_238600 [Chytridium lagenaria]|nr:hypothetical protein BC829DRAFT_238600 [Chytridium lagenaria]
MANPSRLESAILRDYEIATRMYPPPTSFDAFTFAASQHASMTGVPLYTLTPRMLFIIILLGFIRRDPATAAIWRTTPSTSALNSAQTFSTSQQSILSSGVAGLDPDGNFRYKIEEHDLPTTSKGFGGVTRSVAFRTPVDNAQADLFSEKPHNNLKSRKRSFPCPWTLLHPLFSAKKKL